MAGTPEFVRDDINRIQCIIRYSPYKAVIKNRLSYINCLLPSSNSSVVLLYACHPDIVVTNEMNHLQVRESFIGDITGCPLEQTYGDDSFTETIPTVRKNWLKDEEGYQLIPQRIAAQLLNQIGEEIESDNNWTLPIFALCINPSMPTMNEKTVIIGCQYGSEWFTTYNINVSHTQTLKDIRDGCDGLIKKHLTKNFIPQSAHNNYLKNSMPVDIAVTSSYELCGISRVIALSWSKNAVNDFYGYLKIECNWNTLTFTPPTLTTYANKLYVEIISGSTTSPFNTLWNQLCILSKYLLMVEKYHRDHLSSIHSVQPLIFPKNFNNPFLMEAAIIDEKLSSLVIGDIALQTDGNTDNYSMRGADMRNQEYRSVSEFLNDLPTRYNRDFTDKFWDIIKCANCYALMTDCVHGIFESIARRNFMPELNNMEDTRFARLISSTEESINKNVSLHAGTTSLELAIDMGIEKLTRDYMYLLMNTNVTDIYDVKALLMENSVLNGDFDVGQYRKKLIVLMQIHVALEFLELIQSQSPNCHYDYYVLQRIYETAFKACSEPSFLDISDLSVPHVYALSMPVPKEFMAEIRTRTPTSWACKLSSEKSHEKWSTIYHYSLLPVFPPNIYVPEEWNKGQMVNDDNIYHTTTIKINHFKHNNTKPN